MSAVGLPDGAWRYGSTGQLFEAKNGQWIRCLPGTPEFTKPLKPHPEPLDAWEIAIAAVFVILALLDLLKHPKPVTVQSTGEDIGEIYGNPVAR
jgi:hypothetical protein